jgi:hypothetical protein
MVSQPHAFTTTEWNQFLQLSVSQEMIRYLAQKVSNDDDDTHAKNGDALYGCLSVGDLPSQR